MLVPDTTASVFADYRFADGPLAGLGGGVRYLGPSWGDPADTVQVPESVLVDARASYDMKSLESRLAGLTAQLNVQNLLDERTVMGCFAYSGCPYGLPGMVNATNALPPVGAGPLAHPGSDASDIRAQADIPVAKPLKIAMLPPSEAVRARAHAA